MHPGVVEAVHLNGIFNISEKCIETGRVQAVNSHSVPTFRLLHLLYRDVSEFVTH